MAVFQEHKISIKAVDSDAMLIWRLTISTNDYTIQRTELISFYCEIQM